MLARHRFASAVLLSLLCLVLPLRAQVEPQLLTRTDLLDVYKTDAGRSQLITILDFMTSSRAIYEVGTYSTYSGRDKWVDAVPLSGLTVKRTGKDYGFIFLLKVPAAGSPVGTPVNVYLYQWAQTQTFYSEGGVPVAGVPYNFNGTFTGTVVTWQGTAAATIAQITHVRFALRTGSTTRSIDLPCPSQVWDSPYAASGTVPSAPANTAVTNYQKRLAGNTTIQYDPWSEAHNTAVNPVNGAILANIPAGYAGMGNFYYSLDYLCWIYGSRLVRGLNGVDWNAAPTSGNYASPGGYAIPATTENTTVPGVAASAPAMGWANGLPVLTRYQAQKIACIDVLLRKDGKFNWIYRYVDGRVDNPGFSEEGGAPTTAITANPSQSTLWADTSVANRRFLRKLVSGLDGTSGGLTTNGTSLQLMGPSGWVQTYASAPASYDAMDAVSATGNSAPIGPMDPRTPQPWAYALANTYYRASIEVNSTVFEASNASCPGKTYVVIFPTLGLTDSTDTGSPTRISQDAAAAYQNYTTNGNSGLNKGGTGAYAKAPGIGTLTPGTDNFHPGVLSDIAAFADSSNNSGSWGAAWEVSPGRARSAANPGIQTMVVSVGLPGNLNYDSAHNQRSYEGEFFKIAQWADPSRTDLGYGGWRPTKGNNPDQSKLDGGQVFYYPSGSPSALEANLNDVANYMVSGAAALSAPATPTTGTKTTTQAYFGIFKTSRKPAWTGNLFSVGIKRTLDTTTNTEVFSFYGNQGESTIGCVMILDTNGDPVLDAQGRPTYQCGLNNFDDHHLWSAFDIFGNYVPADLPLGATVHPENTLTGTTTSWSNRIIWTLTPGTTTKVRFQSSNNSLVSTLVTQFAAAGRFPASIASSTARTASVQAFIDYYCGKAATDPSKNRVGIFGDIINSAPLAIELGPSNLPTGLTWPGGTDPHARLLLVGTNQGFLHCFMEAANSTAGVVTAKAAELWAFVPPDMLGTMYEVFLNQDVEDTVPHRYLVDGDPALFWEDKPVSGQLIGDSRVSLGYENAIVVFGMRKGARSYYALGLSSATDGSVTPENFKVQWVLDPQLASSSAVVKKMAMSTSVPVFTYVTTDGTISTQKAVVFLSGGYANAQVDDAYRATGAITAAEGMGRSILALDVFTGVPLKTWDWSASTSVGSIPAGVTGVSIFNTFPIIQRVYFTDMKGNVMALNSNLKATEATFRLDSSNVSNWITTPRFIYSNANLRFTQRPDAFRLDGNYPVVVADSSGSSTRTLRPLTVMVSAGSGDSNNPTDAPETYATNGSVTPPALNRMLVLADRQDSLNLGYDTSGIPDTSLQPITYGSWTTTYSDPRVTPGDPLYLFKNKTGYYYTLKDGSLPSAVGGVTHDKILVSPLTKLGTLFFSIFNISGNSGFGCSSNAFTRTFRECDIMRPLAVDTQVQASSTVGDITTLNKGADDCSGLAFYFNSLSSQLADAGDRVVQGGAVSAKTGSFSQQVGANTPDIKSVKDQESNRGFRMRTWRVIH